MTARQARDPQLMLKLARSRRACRTPRDIGSPWIRSKPPSAPIPDYPKAGIIFRDITTLLGDPRAFRRTIDELSSPGPAPRSTRVAGVEARGFILGGAVAHQLSAGFVPIRKKGKLPHTTVRIAYSLEYGLRRDGNAHGRGDAGRTRHPGR